MTIYNDILRLGNSAKRKCALQPRSNIAKNALIVFTQTYLANERTLTATQREVITVIAHEIENDLKLRNISMSDRKNQNTTKKSKPLKNRVKSNNGKNKKDKGDNIDDDEEEEENDDELYNFVKFPPFSTANDSKYICAGMHDLKDVLYTFVCTHLLCIPHNYASVKDAKYTLLTGSESLAGLLRNCWV